MQPGNELHRLLRERIGVDTTKKCDCDSKRIMMNMWGPEGCRKNIEWIVSELLSEATKRSWQIEGRMLLSLAAKIGTKTVWGMAYARSWARSLVTEAIETCENFRSETDETSDHVCVRSDDRTRENQESPTR